MDFSKIIISQYLAALEMLRRTVVQCPDALWDNPDDKTKVWHIAYHVLFYTHLYLQDSEETFTPWAKHREQLAAKLLRGYLAALRLQQPAQLRRLQLKERLPRSPQPRRPQRVASR